MQSDLCLKRLLSDLESSATGSDTCSQHVGLGQAEARGQELHLGLLHGPPAMCSSKIRYPEGS